MAGTRWLRAVSLALALAAGGTASAQDLMQTWQSALASDPVYGAARAQYRAGIERLPQARATLRPLVTAEIGAIYSDVRSTHSLRRRDDRARGAWDLVLTQPLFDWGRWQGYEQAKLVVAFFEIQLRQAQQDLMLRVADAYFNTLSAQDQLSATLSEKSAVEQQLAFARRNFELGSATITDTHEAQARSDLVRAREILLRNTVEVQRDLLARLTGSPPGELARLPPGVVLPMPEPADVMAWSEQAQTSALSVVLAELQSRISERDIDIARSGHYPTLNLQAATGTANARNNSQIDRGRPIDSSIGVVLSIPLYSGGGTSSRVTEAVALQQKARQDMFAAQRAAVQLSREYFTGVTSGLLRVQALQAGEQAGQASVQANRTAYEIGVRVNQDVLNAQQQLFETQRDLAQARYATVMSGLRLKANNGTLNEADLNAINQLLRLPPR